MYFLVLPQHLTGIAFHDSGDDLHERGFARAVLAEQEMHLAPVDRQVAVGEGSYASVPFLNVMEFEEHRKRTVYNGSLSGCFSGGRTEPRVAGEALRPSRKKNGSK